VTKPAVKGAPIQAACHGWHRTGRQLVAEAIKEARTVDAGDRQERQRPDEQPSHQRIAGRQCVTDARRRSKQPVEPGPLDAARQDADGPPNGGEADDDRQRPQQAACPDAVAGGQHVAVGVGVMGVGVMGPVIGLVAGEAHTDHPDGGEQHREGGDDRQRGQYPDVAFQQ
jgi:hypothetical protein